MDYNNRARTNVMIAIETELLETKRRLNDSLSLKDKIRGVEYIGKAEGDEISMLYSTKRSRREHQGTPVLGEIKLREDNGQLALYGATNSSYGHAAEEFQRVAQSVARRFDIPLTFDFQK